MKSPLSVSRSVGQSGIFLKLHMKFRCLGEKNGQNWIFRKNLIFGKKPKDNPKIKFFGFCQKSSPLMFLCTRFILLFCENGISRRKIWFSNYNPKPVRLKDFWNRNISNAIWDIMLIFWIQLVIHNEYKRISYLNGILVRFACECSECSQSIKLQDSWNSYLKDPLRCELDFLHIGRYS